MRDARWYDVESEIADAVQHFDKAVQLHALGGFAGDGLRSYQASMALMHAMQSGHTSLEGALLRILAILGETRPTGERWHEDLVRRATALRPPRSSRDFAADADCRRGGNPGVPEQGGAGYNSFDPSRAAPALEAARQLASELPEAIAAFQKRID